MNRRSTAAIGSATDLDFQFVYNSAPADIHEWVKVEIYNVDPVAFPLATPIQIILPAAITRTGVGLYHYTMDSVAVPGTYYDKAYYIPVDGYTEQTSIKSTIVRNLNPQAAGSPLKGYGFGSPDVEAHNGWGAIITPDELRYIYLWGNPLISPDGQIYTDEMLWLYIDRAVAAVERDLNIELIKKTYKYRPTRFGVDRTDLPVGQIADIDWFWDEPYDFDRKAFNNYIFIRLRHAPLLTLTSVSFRDPLGNQIADITSWAKPNYEMGSLEFFPHSGALASLPLYLASPFYALQQFQITDNYPDAFYVDYDAGFASAEHLWRKWKEIFRVCGLIAAVDLMNDFGDGKSASIASASVGLEGVSESYSTTMSASVGAETLIPVMGGKCCIGKMYKQRDKYIGKLVIAVNPKTNEIGCKRILDVVEHDTRKKQCFELRLSNGARLTVTEDHSLFTTDGKSLTEIKGKDVQIGTHLACVIGTQVAEVVVCRIKPISRRYMYDLSVQDYENFTDINGVLLHNTSAMFGARIESYRKELKYFYANNKNKYHPPVFGIL